MVFIFSEKTISPKKFFHNFFFLICFLFFMYFKVDLYGTPYLALLVLGPFGPSDSHVLATLGPFGPSSGRALCPRALQALGPVATLRVATLPRALASALIYRGFISIFKFGKILFNRIVQVRGKEEPQDRRCGNLGENS